MAKKMDLESRFMRTMLPPLYASSVDKIVKQLEEEPMLVGNNSLKMLRDMLGGMFGMHFREQATNLFFAGILTARALDYSTEFQEVMQKFLDDDAKTGRDRIIPFLDARAKMKGF